MWACDPATTAEIVNSYNAAGPLFVQTLQSFLAAQCALAGDHLWPRDMTAAAIEDPNYDFIVVGAGSAGSVVANRLSEVPNWKVLLIEAGGDPDIGTEIPQLFYNNIDTKTDWSYKIQPQESACRGNNENRCAWPRGKVLGGCSSINAMFYVRGNKLDYDEWAASDLEACRKFDNRSDEFLICIARELTFSLYHPVGTAKMGPKDDETAVVDPELKSRQCRSKVVHLFRQIFEMDLLTSNIATVCPLAFSGTGGEIFLRAVTTLVAAHCSIVDNDWPLDNSEEVIKKSKVGGSYDFIVIGAGTAGSLIASRLSNIYPSKSILLVEAGDDPGIESEVPAFLFYNQNTMNDWNYKTEPDGRSCLGFENNSCIWSKGKAMGGSGSINAMIYIRGHPEDFADWGKGWDYDALLPYFENQEEYLKISDYIGLADNQWYEIMDESWRELHFATRKYQDYEARIGTKLATLLTRNGRRLNTAKVYLQSAGNNLHIMKNALVEEIIIDSKARRASGIKVRYNNGASINIFSTRDVVLSAGSIGTPHLLMLSGIGLKNHLTKNNIPCVIDLPVGQNLQDHLIVPLYLKTNIKANVLPESIELYLLQYMLNRSGPFSKIGITDFMGFINTRNNSEQPDVQFHHMYYPRSDKASLLRYLEGIGYREDVMNSVADLNNRYDLLGIYPTLLHPKSKGAVMLNSKRPGMKPKIIPNYLEHPDDTETLIDAIKFVHTLESTKAFKKLGIQMVHIDLEGCSQFVLDSDSYWKCYIQHMAITIYHPAGTAKMGDDETSVVNNDLLVHGVDNLRVADASVMPTMPGANIMAATLVIAQKAVDIMQQTYSQKSEL
ncbi:unnamed protein product, partial [Iphiclides podalirius]